MYQWFDFFIDPLLRAPTIGSILMCVTASLVGVIVFVRKRSLVGEALSHAAYPGVVLGAWAFALCFSHLEEFFSIFLLVGAFISSLCGLFFLHFLQNHFRIKSDSALCFVLSSFFGLGVLFASRMQYTQALWYKQIQAFLYGQPATMIDFHIWMYGVLCVGVVAFIVFFYRQVQLVNFDSQFASSLGLSVKSVESLFFCLLVLAVTVAIRGVGVVLLSGMLIAPALAARQMTHKLSKMFVFAALIGALSAFSGNYFSVKCSEWFSGYRFVLPIGPMIVLSGSFLCFISLFFSPKRGLLFRILRKRRFSKICEEENLLKIFWKLGDGEKRTCKEFCLIQQRSWRATWVLLRRLTGFGWVIKKEGSYQLSKEGEIKARHIIRLHRLWEVYLVHLGQCREKVHASAEEMEHVITPELERRLAEYLNDPKEDPHFQPIPVKERGV